MTKISKSVLIMIGSNKEDLTFAYIFNLDK